MTSQYIYCNFELSKRLCTSWYKTPNKNTCILLSTLGYVYLSELLIFSQDVILKRKKGEIIPHGVAFENSRLSLPCAASTFHQASHVV